MKQSPLYLHRLATGPSTIGHLGKGLARPRSYSVHQRLAPKLSAACSQNDCPRCFSLNCTHDCHPRPIR